MAKTPAPGGVGVFRFRAFEDRTWRSRLPRRHEYGRRGARPTWEIPSRGSARPPNAATCREMTQRWARSGPGCGPFRKRRHDYYIAGEGRRLFGHTTPSELRDKFMMSTRNPVGVVGAITPWNFPIAIPSWKIAPALVCGNTLVLKPAAETPLLAERFVEISEEAGLPPGVLNIVHGAGKTVGAQLVRHPDVPLITFTGSHEVGVQVAQNGAPLLKHVHLELGGKNAIIVMDDADIDLTVEGILWSAFGTSGQRCTAASRVIAHEQVYDELRSKLVTRAEKMRLGTAGRGTDVGPVINQAALDKIHSYTEIGRAKGDARDRGRGRDREGLDRGFSTADRVRRRRAGHAIAQERSSGRRQRSSALPTSTRRSESRTGSVRLSS